MTVAELNDKFRTTFTGGRIILTQSVATLPDVARDRLIASIRLFEDFTEENDPYGERDFGSVKVGEDTYFWKIDYYNKTMDGGSENPTDPNVTTRVLTIMHSSEY